MTEQKTFNVDTEWYNHIISGNKKIEGRLRKGKSNELVIGEIIFFAESNGTDQIEARITKINKYDSFENYLMMEGVSRALPGKEWISDGIDIYRSFYSKEDERKYGVVGIHFELIN